MDTKAKRKRLGILMLLAPAVLLLGIQGLGSVAIDEAQRPVFDFPAALSLPMAVVGVTLSVISPMTSMVAAVLVYGWAASRGRHLLLLLCVLLVASSSVGCAWTFSGHPTWLLGYSHARSLD